MVLWSEFDKNLIQVIPVGKDGKVKFKNLRFQIPRGVCMWGVSAFKSLQVDIAVPEFLEWWKDLEATLCIQEPFNSNLKLNSLRVKVDGSTYFFDENSKQVNPDIVEGMLRGQELTCLVEIDGTYFFNGVWGLIVRASQVKSYGAEAISCDSDESVLAKGKCAFLSAD